MKHWIPHRCEETRATLLIPADTRCRWCYALITTPNAWPADKVLAAIAAVPFGICVVLVFLKWWGYL